MSTEEGEDAFNTNKGLMSPEEGEDTFDLSKGYVSPEEGVDRIRCSSWGGSLSMPCAQHSTGLLKRQVSNSSMWCLVETARKFLCRPDKPCRCALINMVVTLTP